MAHNIQWNILFKSSASSRRKQKLFPCFCVSQYGVNRPGQSVFALEEPHEQSHVWSVNDATLLACPAVRAWKHFSGKSNPCVFMHRHYCSHPKLPLGQHLFVLALRSFVYVFGMKGKAPGERRIGFQNVLQSTWHVNTFKISLFGHQTSLKRRDDCFQALKMPSSQQSFFFFFF